MTDLLIQELDNKIDDIPKKIRLIRKLIDLGLGGDVKAIKEIFNRIEGRVTESMRLVDEDGNDTNFNVTITVIDD